ncbi:MAG: stage II sporulation protein P, partial [Clostridia bacterium]|nr:stage II sporulation protein P [Clostridia bacterium]
SSVTQDPLVLVLHTHASEGYLPEGTKYVEGNIGDATYSKDGSKTVLAVGKVLCDTLNQKGITAIHCTVMHDEEGLQGSYERSLHSIRFFLEHYPSIRYVIDLHRDAVINKDGEYLKSVGKVNGAEVAQVMAVVGSDGGGSECPNWEGNLALALQLGELLNRDGARIFRPLSLRNSTYNQELAPYSLLLEIGTGGNSPEEAKRAAVLVGEALARLIYP